MSVRPASARLAPAPGAPPPRRWPTLDPRRANDSADEMILDTRLRQVLAAGAAAVPTGAPKRAAYEMSPSSSRALDDPDDPLFLLVQIIEISKELAKIKEPSNPNAAYEAEQAHIEWMRVNEPMSFIPDHVRVAPASHTQMMEYEEKMAPIRVRRARLNAMLDNAQTKMRNAMSPAGQQQYDAIFSP